MKRFFSLLLLCALLTSVCACQPTPEESIVVNKNDGQLEASIFGEDAPAVDYDFPTEWTEDSIEAASGNVTINVNAKVTTPDVESYPIYYVSLDEEFSQEYADTLLNYFIGDAELFSPDELALTKNEIMDIISTYDGYIQNADPETGTIADHEGLSAKEFEEEIEFLQNEIARLQEEFKTAPVEAVPAPVSRTFTEAIDPETGKSTGYQIQGRTEDGAFVTLYKDAEGRMNMRRTISVNIPKKGVFQNKYLTTDIAEYGMTNYTLETARELADKTLADLGKEGYSVAFAASCSLYYPDRDDSGPDSERPRGFMFYYAKEIDGIPMLLEFNSYYNIEAYTEQWPRHFIRIVVTNEGVSNYYEYSSLKLGEKLNENIALLPFEKIQEIFREYIAMKVSVFGEDDDRALEHTVSIDDIRLGYVRIAEKDRNDRGYLVPVWQFYGSETYKYNSQNDTQLLLDENNEYLEFDIGHSYLCINAIDGSIIDLAAGY